MMHKMHAGEKYGRVMLNKLMWRKGSTYVWRCVCDCGKEFVALYSNVVHGTHKSCGCFRKESARRQKFKHGMTGTPEHQAWKHIKRRCYNRRCQDYENYGGRGISVCDEWRGSFQTFYLHMGKRPSARHSIDRINNDGNYEPGNCRWATPKEQRANQRPRKESK